MSADLQKKCSEAKVNTAATTPVHRPVAISVDCTEMIVERVASSKCAPTEPVIPEGGSRPEY